MKYFTLLLMCSCSSYHSYKREFTMQMAKNRPSLVLESSPKIMIFQDFKIDYSLHQEDHGDLKGFYLQTLLGQYYTLAGNSAKDLKTCPSYHNAFLEQSKDTGQERTFKIDFQKLSENSYLASKPELFLEINGKTVLEQITPSNCNDLLDKALTKYTDNLFKEITYLCSTGTSPHLYTYINMINMNSKLAPNNAFTLPITINAALIRSLFRETRGIASSHNLYIPWLDSYLLEAIP